MAPIPPRRATTAARTDLPDGTGRELGWQGVTSLPTTWAIRSASCATQTASPRAEDREPETAGATAAVRLSMRRAGRCRRGPPRQVYVSCWNDSAIGGGRATRHDPNRGGRAPERPGRHGGRVAPSSRARTPTPCRPSTREPIARCCVSASASSAARWTGSSPQALALSDDGRVLFVANAQTQSVAGHLARGRRVPLGRSRRRRSRRDRG